MFERWRALLWRGCESIRPIGVVATLLFASSFAASPAYAQSVHYGDGPPPGVDPFCGVSLSMAGWDVKSNAESATSDRLLATLFTQGKKLSARLVLMTATEAFSVHVLPLMTFKLVSENGTSQFLIALPKAVEVKNAYIESYSADGAPEVQCAIEPFKLGQFDYATVGLNRPSPALLNHYITFPATLKEKLPVTNCGAPDRDAIVTHAVQPDGIENLDKMRTAIVAVYVDATGQIAKTYLTRSSGIDVTDEQAQAAAIRSTYQPALIHCMPVNAAYLFTVEFDK
ncbi:MAG TPA: energy transducer TonB [Candidatus Tumulicola sp.]|jgi:hypothetical protein